MSAVPAPSLPSLAQPWHARLRLAVALRASRSVLVDNRHEGPLRIQKALYPEGGDCAQLLMLHPPGGIASGDELDIRLDVGADAQALLTTPGAGKWYRSAGRVARQNVLMRADAGARLEWLPQETIVFDGAIAEQRLRVELAGDARCCGWDIVVLGRQARDESFRHGAWSQQIEIIRDGRLLWKERSALRGGDALLEARVGWQGRHVAGLMWAVGTPFTEELVEACRAIETPELAFGVTQVQPGLLLIRALGRSAERTRAAFAAAWAALRPSLMGRAAQVPRIWRT